MSTFSVTYSISRRELTGSGILCPCCGEAMKVEDLFNKRGRFDGTTAICVSGCKSDDKDTPNEALMFYSYDVEEVRAKVERYKLILR